MNIFCKGFTWIISEKNSVFIQALSLSLKLKVYVTKNLNQADLIVISPLIINKTNYIFVKTVYYLNRMGFIDSKRAIRIIFRLPKSKPILAVSFENLDAHRFKWFGDLIRNAGLPRLTHWPHSIDPQGCYYPYFYEFLDWENIKLDNEKYKRYGKKLSIKKLMAPLDRSDHDKRIDAVCALIGHVTFPRKQIIDHLKKTYRVDVFGKNTKPWDGSKYDLIKKYKYCFVAENSLGYGYETEKLPEAWNAGCIPVGYLKCEPSAFNLEAVEDVLNKNSNLKTSIHLLKEKPDLKHLFDYFLKNFNIMTIKN